MFLCVWPDVKDVNQTFNRDSLTHAKNDSGGLKGGLVGGLCVCVCPFCAYLLVYTHAYMWERWFAHQMIQHFMDEIHVL